MTTAAEYLAAFDEAAAIVTACNARHAELAAQMDLVAAERAAAIALLVAAERSRRAALGLPERGAATFVATRLRMSPERVSQILAASKVKTT